MILMQKVHRAFAHYSLPLWPSWAEEPPDDVMRAQLSFTLLPSRLSQPPAFHSASFPLLFFLPFSGGTNKFGIPREERREETLQRPQAAAELVTYLPF